jgi:Icc protein
MKRRDAVKTLLAGSTGTIAAGRAGWLPAGEPSDSGAPARKPAVRFAHFTDCHVYDRRRAAEGLAAAIRHVHARADRPDFILNGGDAIYDALDASREAVERQWTLWQAAWKEHGELPVRHCLGNHDVWGWNRAKSQTSGQEAGWGKQLALDRLGLERSYYAFDAGGWRLIVLDSMTLDAETAYRAELDPEQREWLAGELKATPPQTPIAIVSHIPILTVGAVGFAPELRKQPQAAKMLAHVDDYELLGMFTSHPNVKLCLSGHTHLTEKITFGQIDFVNSGAVCGLWWKGRFLHTSEGYNLVELFDDGTYTAHYETYGWTAAS